MLTLDFPGSRTLIDAIDAAVAKPTTHELTDSLRQSLCRLIREQAVRLPECVFEANPEHYARRELYRSEDHGYCVVAMTWGPGQGTPIHDHSTWGVAGIVENELRIVNYDRMDDGSKPGYADLREASAIEAPAGTVTYILPPNDVIHLIVNPTDRTTISLHVYGKSVECNQFDLEKKSYGSWTLSYDKPCPC